MLRHRIQEALETDWRKDIKEVRMCVQSGNVVFAQSWRLLSTTSGVNTSVVYKTHE